MSGARALPHKMGDVCRTRHRLLMLRLLAPLGAKSMGKNASLRAYASTSSETTAALRAAHAFER